MRSTNTKLQTRRGLFSMAASLLVGAGMFADQLPAQKMHDSRRPVDLAICLDTSGSMRGLIDSARQSIWAIVNDLALATPTPRLRIALLTFGNDGHDKRAGWVRVDTGFTEDLDLVSLKLFALGTNGGTELVGRVLKASLDQLDWTSSSDSLKLIVVAGNESADQDREIDFRGQCRRAIGKGIMVNAIYCGNAADGLAPAWREVAALADGKFHAIDQHGTVALQSPFDKQITGLSTRLNSTYIPIGEKGRVGRLNQIIQDKNALKMNSKAAAQRGASKSSLVYGCAWDLVDNLRRKTLKLEDVKVSDLPAVMQKMTLTQRQKYVDEMFAKRKKMQTDIQALTKKREHWVQVERKKLKLGSGVSFESAMRKAVRQQASSKGLTFPQSKSKSSSSRGRID